MIWWKIYFWILLVLTLIGIPILFQYSLGLVDIIGLFFNIFLLLAVYSYVFKKKLLQAIHWKILFWVLVFFGVEEALELTVLPNFLANLSPFLGSGLDLTKGERIFSLIAALPGVYATHRLTLKQ